MFDMIKGFSDISPRNMVFTLPSFFNHIYDCMQKLLGAMLGSEGILSKRQHVREAENIVRGLYCLT